MPPVKEPYLESLVSSHSRSGDTHTVLRGQRSTAKPENKMVFHPFKNAKHTADTVQPELGISTCYVDLAETQGQLRPWLPLTHQLSELKQEPPTLPLDSPFPPRRLCQYTKQARSTGATGVILRLSPCSYMGNKLALLIAQNYPFQATGFSKQVRI